MFGNLGMGELLIIFLIVLLLFGSKRLPDLAKGIGHAIKVFKDEINGIRK
ncbi:MAG: twin-arginine translocase TatA/TatE family subunit [Elusimicrobiota bacterium]